MTRSGRRPKRSPEALLEKLASGDPETRWSAARDLATRGDRSAIAPLEQIALHDEDSFSREGAFVDSIEAPYDAALDALRSIYRRHPPSPDDIARVRSSLEYLRERAELLAATLGKSAVEAAEPLLQHTDVMIRLRATNVIAHARGSRSNAALWSDDEEVRLAATQQDAYRGRLVWDALDRFPEEPSLRVRRGICDLWLRYRARMGGALQPHEGANLLVDPDPEIHERVAQHVLDTAERSRTWTFDPAGFRPIRDQLATMREARSGVLRDVLALLDEALAPFAKGATAPRDKARRD